MTEKPLSKGGFLEIFPEVITEFQTSDRPERIALEAGLSQRQWRCLASYVSDPDINHVAKELDLRRSNVYSHLNLAFIRLEKRRRGL